MRKLALSFLLLSLFSPLQEDCTTSTAVSAGAVHFTDLPTPPVEFDVHDNIETKGDSPSRVDLAPGSIPRDRRRSIPRARAGRESTAIYLTALLFLYTEPNHLRRRCPTSRIIYKSIISDFSPRYAREQLFLQF